MNKVKYYLNKEIVFKGGINQIIKHNYVININNKKEVEFETPVKVNDFDVREDENYLKILIALFLIDNYYTYLRFGAFKDLDDIRDFIDCYGFECEKGLKTIKEIKEISEAMNLDLTEEELQACDEAYSDGSIEAFKSIEKIIYDNFEFEKE